MFAVSQLKAVDIGVGRKLEEAFIDYGTQYTTTGFSKFQQRSTATKIFRAEQNSPSELITKMADYNSKMSEQDDESAQVFRLGFPLVSYHRDGSLQVEGRDAFVHNLGYWLEGEDKKKFSYHSCRLNLNYQILLMAKDRPTLDIMQLALLFFLSNVEKKHHCFQVRYQVSEEMGDEGILEGNCQIQDPKSMMFSEISTFTQEAGFVYASCLKIVICTNIYAGHLIPFVKIKDVFVPPIEETQLR